jgi:hypothetical protein
MIDAALFQHPLNTVRPICRTLTRRVEWIARSLLRQQRYRYECDIQTSLASNICEWFDSSIRKAAAE